MPEDKTTQDLASAWKSQPDESPVKLEGLLDRRTRELDTANRSEILISLGAALFFVAVIAWREPFLMKDQMSQAGFAAVAAWVLISLYWFRHRIWRSAPRKDALAVPGIDFYRQSLAGRRDQLKNAWLWHGPLFLACAIFTAMLMWRRIIAYRGLERVLPFGPAARGLDGIRHRAAAASGQWTSARVDEIEG